MTPSYGWYGDDFTGATDTLATLARRGRSAFLFLRVPEEQHLNGFADLDAVGIAGAARTMSPDEMRAELEPVGAFFRALGVRLLHYKCCSTFDSAPERGNLATAIAVLRGSVQHPGAAILGGQPSLGRYCAFSNLFAAFGRDGVHRLDRHPVMSRHPATPMNEADLRLHFAALGLPGVQGIHWPALGHDGAADEWEALSSTAPAVLFDALEAGHVGAVGRLLREASRGRSLLAVGPSSVAQAFFEERDGIATAPPVPAEGPVLAFVGSLSATTRAQMAAARSYRRIAVDPGILTTSADARTRIAEEAASLLADGRHVMLSTAPDEGDVPLSAAASLPDLSAVLVDDVLKRCPVRRLAVAGGDTSSKIVGHLGYWGLGYYGQIGNGVAVSATRSDDAARDNMVLMLKGGQMGQETLFEDFLEDRAHW
ncbi:four-carbon acid sugar kinase family protein [Microvirga pudoricolor]|uniref:four-carbon acid sugar kinase family protein n=1 Tax=Microvirga pudoricolor TaxID=2778729 RepID=UPI00194F6374|nr:four-carbon acid sugar kinase family protein [Microvirga pudoricolor]MBM6595157.1 four-carbon acid sugar kinase family protein [Microvirga pudoricolor]